MKQKPVLTVSTTVAAPIETVWELWTAPAHITQWNAASDEWHSPQAVNDLREGGRFSYRMEARDGSMGFDFNGHYTSVVHHRQIDFTIEDGRTVTVRFSPQDGSTTVEERFEAEETHPEEMQQSGWQAILDNFKRYAEAYSAGQQA